LSIRGVVDVTSLRPRNVARASYGLSHQQFASRGVCVAEPESQYQTLDTDSPQVSILTIDHAARLELTSGDVATFHLSIFAGFVHLYPTAIPEMM
jgi:hypothetical protein